MKVERKWKVSQLLSSGFYCHRKSVSVYTAIHTFVIYMYLVSLTCARSIIFSIHRRTVDFNYLWTQSSVIVQYQIIESTSYKVYQPQPGLYPLTQVNEMLAVYLYRSNLKALPKNICNPKGCPLWSEKNFFFSSRGAFIRKVPSLEFDSGDYFLNEYINSLSKWMDFKQYCTIAF